MGVADVTFTSFVEAAGVKVCEAYCSYKNHAQSTGTVFRPHRHAKYKMRPVVTAVPWSVFCWSQPGTLQKAAECSYGKGQFWGHIPARCKV